MACFPIRPHILAQLFPVTDNPDRILAPDALISLHRPMTTRFESVPDIVSVMVLVRITAVVAFVALSWVCTGAARVPGASQAANQAPEITDARLIVRELCGKNVALLGESPLHGFGKTLQFKVGLVRRSE